MADITVIGATFADVKGFSKGEYHPRERNLGNIIISHGGVCRNVAENISGTGKSVRLVSLVDDGVIGQDVLNRLNGAGVDTNYVKKVPGGMGMWLAVMDETRDIAGQISMMPDTAELERIIDEKGDEIFADTKSAILEFDAGESLTEKVIKLCEKYSVKLYCVVGNLSIMQKRPELLYSLSCIICNEAEIGRLCGKDLSKIDAPEMLSFITELIKEKNYPPMIITMGDKGAVYYDPKTQESGICPVIKSVVKDTTGAGDAFLSGAVVGFERGYNMADACALGTKMAHYIIETEESSSADMNF